MSVDLRPTLRARPRRTRMRATTTALLTLSFAILVVIAFLPFWPVYRSAEFAVAVGAGLVLGAAIALAGASLKLSSFWVLIATAIAFFVFGVPVAVPSQTTYGVVPTLAGLRELTTATALSWKQLLTISLPVGSYEALLVPAFLLSLTGTVVGVSVALRARRAEVATVAPVVILLTGIVLGPTEAFLPLVAGICLLAGSILWVVWWRLRRRRIALDGLAAATRSTATPTVGSRGSGHRSVVLRSLGGTLVTLLVAAGLATAATTVLPPAHHRVVGRTLVNQPFDPRDYSSPLSGFRAYEQKPTVDQPQLTVSGLGRSGFVRIATLDTYDGVNYSVGSAAVSTASGSFTRVPSTFDQSKAKGTQSTVDVTVDGYEGVWLPTVGKLESVRFAGTDAANLRGDFFYNDTTGTAAVIGGIRSGVSYTLTSVIPRQPAASALAGFTPGSAIVPSPTGVPAALKTALADYTDGVKGAGAQLQAAMKAIKAKGYISHGVASDPVSISGHGADRLAELFTAPRMLGDAEQYAAATALMADQLGFPARVVMGFAPSRDEAGTSPVALTGADITARVEIDTKQSGWVLLDPNPPVRPIPDEQVQDPNKVSQPQSVVQPPPHETDPQNNQAQPPTKQNDPSQPPAWVAVVLLVVRIVAWVALIAGIVMAPFIVIAAGKARRRRRRRRTPEPGRRIVAGWQEFHDSVVDHGIPMPRAATRSEVAGAVGGARAGVLARVADQAVFAPEASQADDADRVWRAVSDLRSALDTGLTTWQRFKAAVSPRSLRGYHGPKDSKR